MTTKVHAVYQNGVFRPSTLPSIVEGIEVVFIVTDDQQGNLLADALDEIAHLPIEGPQDGFSGADHDRVLYNTNQDK